MNYFRNTFLCSTCGFFINVATGTSSWFVVCIACERLLVVKFPLKARSFTSKTKAVVTLLAVTVVMFLMNSYLIFMVDYNTTTCRFLLVFKDFNKTAQGMLFAVGLNLLPLCITCLSYISLVFLVIRKRKVAPQPQSGGIYLFIIYLNIFKQEGSISFHCFTLKSCFINSQITKLPNYQI